MGHPVNVPIRRTAHLFSVVPTNDTKESMFGHRNVSGSNLGPLAPEASALTTELPRFYVITRQSTELGLVEPVNPSELLNNEPVREILKLVAYA